MKRILFLLCTFCVLSSSLWSQTGTTVTGTTKTQGQQTPAQAGLKVLKCVAPATATAPACVGATAVYGTVTFRACETDSAGRCKFYREVTCGGVTYVGPRLGYIKGDGTWIDEAAAAGIKQVPNTGCSPAGLATEATIQLQPSVAEPTRLPASSIVRVKVIPDQTTVDWSGLSDAVPATPAAGKQSESHGNVTDDEHWTCVTPASVTNPASGAVRFFFNASDSCKPYRKNSDGSTTLIEGGGGGGSGDITDVGNCATGACFQTAAQNAVLAGPPSGGAGVAAMRALVAADIPPLDASKITTGSLPDARVDDTITLTNITQITNRAITDLSGTAARAQLPAQVVYDDEANTYGAVKQDFGAATLEIPNAATLPATCAVGEIFQDNDAAVGARLYLCTALNTWTAVDNPFGTAINDSEVDDAITASNYLPLAGGTLTGELVLHTSAPISGGGLADCDTAGKALNWDATGKLFSCRTLADADIPDTITASSYLPLAGGVLTGNLDLDNQKDVRLRELDANGDNFLGFRAPAAVALADEGVFEMPPLPAAAGFLKAGARAAGVSVLSIAATVGDADLASNYSGIGACGANTWASTLNDNAAPTCTQPGISNLASSTSAQLATVLSDEQPGATVLFITVTSLADGHVPCYDGVTDNRWENCALSNEFLDSVFRVTDNADATKKLAFELSGFTTATTRTVTPFNGASVIPEPRTCSGTDKVSAISAAGVVTCSADQLGAGGGDALTVATVAATDPDFIDTATVDVTLDTAASPDTIKWDVVANSIGPTQLDETANYTWTGIHSFGGATLSGGSPLVLEGATADAFETTVVVTDPTAARTFTLPNANSVAVQPDAGAANQFLTAISTLGVISKAAIADADVPNNITIDLAALATALAANGSNCSAGSYPLGVSAAGASESCTDYGTETKTFTNKTLDAEGTGNVLTTVSKVWLEAAACQNATATLMWDTPTASPAVAACVTGTNTQKGVADFADGSNLSMQRTLRLPSDFTGNVDVDFKWLTTATTGNVVWQFATICVADAETDDPAFNTASTVTDTAKGTTNQTNDASIASVTITGCAAGELLHIKVFRDSAHASDTLAATARLIGLELTLRRAQ